MSIVTKTGDTGTTALMYGRRVPKSDLRVEACGCVDEVNAALGLARVFAQRSETRQAVQALQTRLITLMGELATEENDLERYVKDGFKLVTADLTLALETTIHQIESLKIAPRGWATPGDTAASAALDVARTLTRRAERRVCSLQEAGRAVNPEILVFLNRASDFLWLLARFEECPQASFP